MVVKRGTYGCDACRHPNKKLHKCPYKKGPNRHFCRVHLVPVVTCGCRRSKKKKNSDEKQQIRKPNNGNDSNGNEGAQYKNKNNKNNARNGGVDQDEDNVVDHRLFCVDIEDEAADRDPSLICRDVRLAYNGFLKEVCGSVWH